MGASSLNVQLVNGFKQFNWVKSSTGSLVQMVQLVSRVQGFECSNGSRKEHI